jgi:1-acyl-sn-glycerol-3-phosphate acyltransferase
MAITLTHPNRSHARESAPAPRASVREHILSMLRQVWYVTRWIWWHSYWRLSVTGMEHVPDHGATLLCSNHTSHLDAPAILAALPVRVALRASTAAAKDFFGDHRARNAVSRLTTNSVPLERDARFARGLRSLEQVLKERRPLVMFPEGRRSQGGQLQPFKNGAAMLSLRTGAPIVPIHIDGLHESFPRGALFPRPGGVRLRFAAPIDPRPYQRAVAQGRISRREAYGQMMQELKAAIEGLAHDREEQMEGAAR